MEGRGAVRVGLRRHPGAYHARWRGPGATVDAPLGWLLGGQEREKGLGDRWLTKRQPRRERDEQERQHRPQRERLDGDADREVDPVTDRGEVSCEEPEQRSDEGDNEETLCDGVVDPDDDEEPREPCME